MARSRYCLKDILKLKKKFLLATMGTQNGDLNPFIGIAQELVCRGHGVILATNGGYRQKIERLGLDYLPLRPAMSHNEGTTWFEYGLKSHLKEYRYLLRELAFPHVAWNYRQLEKVAPGCDAMLCSSLAFPVPLIAKKLGKPWASSTVTPMGYLCEYTGHRIIGRTSPWNFLWRAPLPPLLGRVARFMIEKLTSSWAAPFRELRQSLNLPGPGDIPPLLEVLHSPHLNLALFSGVIAKARQDWPQPTVQTGFALYRQEKESLSKETREFLAEGEPPLLFFPGSWGYTTTKGKPFCKSAAEAALLMGKRAIFIIGRGVERPPDVPRDESLLFTGYEPFSQLVPQVSTLVHIGGMGSISHGLYGGKPQVSVPFFYEQCGNALHLQELGVSATIPISRLNSVTLCHKIDQVETQPYRERALRVKTQIAGENGAQAAADQLEALVLS